MPPLEECFAPPVTFRNLRSSQATTKYSRNRTGHPGHRFTNGIGDGRGDALDVRQSMHTAR